MKIAIVGPESTGKSTMATSLATHYNTISIPEYAREYCQGLNRSYTLNDEINIFYGQLALENQLLLDIKHPFVFCDTMVLTVKVWCDHLFGFTPNPILPKLKRKAKQYDLFLLMDIDLPWEDDELRDFPRLREHFLKIWHKELTDINANYKVISGLGEERFDNARKVVEQFLKETEI